MPERWGGFMGLWHRVFDRIEALPVPVIAGVHGLALAGGLELVLVADLVVADEARGSVTSTRTSGWWRAGAAASACRVSSARGGPRS